MRGIRRRGFIRLLGGAAVWPIAARAQRPPVPMVGYLFEGPPAAALVAPFRKGLSEMGFVEGRNVTIEYRYGEDLPDRLPALATELIRHGAAVIFASGGTSAVTAAKAATATIPIVFGNGDDPVQAGLVASFNRPGGNVTGVTFLIRELTAKRLGLLQMLLPAASRFALLIDPRDQRIVPSLTADAQAAAATIGRQIEVFTASTNDEIDVAFASLVQKRADALLVGSGPLFFARRAQIATLAVRHALPAIYFAREFVELGGLMSYGASIADTVRQGGIYVGRILKGEKPADLPVIQPTRFEFVINLTTARAVGIDVPPTLLALADEVIE
jgi:putative tryptophan/tyrosine transport system substrate-binding protein